MTKLSVEEIVARWERAAAICGYTEYRWDAYDLRALIASWRERGAMIDAIHVVLNEHDGDDAMGRIRDVLYGGGGT